MYVRSSHRPLNAQDVAAVMQRHMFATLVTTSTDTMVASHLPFLFDPSQGEHGTLYAHMARANPHATLLGREVQSLVIFQGPHAYISPSWYVDRATAPTWNCVAVHCYGMSHVHADDEAEFNVRRLVAAMERERSKGWSADELKPDQVSGMLRNVVSFDIAISRIDAKFKLNQGEKAERTASAIHMLELQGHREVADYMRRYNELE